MSGYRVFISYSHADRKSFEIVRAALEDLGLRPWSDEDLSVGHGFTEEIQKYIAHSHLFVPIITPASHARGWVHQEIGYAVAMHVPVIPLCVGQLPEGMIQMAHAIVMDDLPAQCAARLAKQNFDNLVSAAGKRWLPAGECAHEPGERAELIEAYADSARHAIGPQCVRHAGGLSSFRIPDEPSSHPVWRAGYGTGWRGDEANKKLRKERQALSKHADQQGCKLVVNYGVDLDKAYGVGAWSSRIRSLVEYLQTLPDNLVEIALVTDMPPQAFLTVGNWFLAESAAVRPVRGIQHTLFATHAPSIDRRIEEFDQDLQSLIKKQGSPPGQSRAWAIDVLTKRMNELPRHPDWP